MKKLKKFPMKFAPSDKIDDFAHELIDLIFKIKGALLTNESTLEDFESVTRIPGHRLVHLSSIQKSKQHLYQEELQKLPEYINPKQYLVWYPPVANEQWDGMSKLTRESLLKKVEDKFNVPLIDFPRNEPLYVWKVAALIKRKQRES